MENENDFQQKIIYIASIDADISIDYERSLVQQDVARGLDPRRKPSAQLRLWRVFASWSNDSMVLPVSISILSVADTVDPVYRYVLKQKVWKDPRRG